MFAKQKKAHTEAETVIAPALAIIVESILGTEAAEKVKKLPLSKDTISRGIVDLSSDLKDQIREHFEASEVDSPMDWSLQIYDLNLLNLLILVEKLTCWHLFDLLKKKKFSMNFCFAKI